MASAERPGTAYWVIVVLLVVLGYLTGFTIGGLFWFLALAMILLAPFRSRPRFFATGLALFVGFLVGFVLTAPAGCTQTAELSSPGSDPVMSSVECRSLVGIEYSGPDPFQPSLVLPLGIAVIAAAVAAGTTWYVTGRRVTSEESEVEEPEVS